MSHIHTSSGQYDFTVGAYILKRIDDNYVVLLHKHKKIGKYLPIGGHIELDESPLEATYREVYEESGYQKNQLHFLQPITTLTNLSDVETMPSPVVIASYNYDLTHKHTDLAYGLLVEVDPPGPADVTESADFCWLTLDELNGLSKEQIFTNTLEIYSYLIKQVMDGNYSVSGS